MNKNEKDSIIDKLNEMEAIIRLLMIYFEMFQKKPNIIFKQLLVKQLLTSEEIYNSFINEIDKKIDIFKALSSDLSDIATQLSNIKLEDVSEHYRNFLINELVNINMSTFPYTDDYHSRIVKVYFDKINENPITYTADDENSIQALNWICQYHNQIVIPIQNKVIAYKIFEKVKDIDCNIVLIGANGSGKSTFARNLRGKLSDNITILSAQHLLIYTKPDTISINNMELERVYTFQTSNKLGSDSNLVQLFSSDFNNLISALMFLTA